MSNPPNSTPGRSGLSLYANLLDPDSTSSPGSGATISRGPVAFNQDAIAENEASIKKQQINAASLRFQPTKRPQLAIKQKPKTSLQKTIPPASTPSIPTNSAPTPGQAPVKTSLADWTNANDDDVNGFYAGEKRQRGGKKRRKKNKEDYVIAQNWDDIYDPSRPNNYDEYKHSDEKIREVREWKDRLYAHRIARRYSSDLDSSDEDKKRPQKNNQFAPPPNMSFAPPPLETPKPAEVPENHHSGEDVYARRLALGQQNTSPPPPPSQSSIPPPPPAISSATISRAPVRYNLPPPPPEIPATEEELNTALEAEAEDNAGTTHSNAAPEDAPRSLRPGQQGFAARLMSKYGWTKGSGLGADGSGIINPLHVKLEKRRKKADSEGGGFADPKGIGKIVGGQRRTADNSSVGKFGDMSEVIVLRGMVDGVETDEGDGELMQEIGDECAEKYGRVERVFIDRSGESTPTRVFVKFTSQLSGLRAVNALEGRVFSGNTISAKFHDAEKFEQGVYE